MQHLNPLGHSTLLMINLENINIYSHQCVPETCFSSYFQKGKILIFGKESIFLFLLLGRIIPFWKAKKFILSLCMLLVFGALKNVSFSNNNRISKFLQKVLKISFWVSFPVQKICYQVLSSARDCIYTSHSGSFIPTDFDISNGRFLLNWYIC